ncbi:uncharacterized protein [Eurosta solidaginis]|uniref:uncharacterized protein n=1 Tax=Eurosta solidaginis TaxID=178769 RepID=UPI0035314D37
MNYSRIFGLFLLVLITVLNSSNAKIPNCANKKTGEIFQVKGDCHKYKCLGPHGGVEKLPCPKADCEYDGVIAQVGETFFVEGDCRTFTCLDAEGTLQIDPCPVTP